MNSMAVFIAASGAAILLLLLLVFFNAPPQGTASDGHDPVALPGRSIPPRTNIPNAVPSQRLDAQPIRDVRIVRLSVLPNQPHHEIICGEFRLYDAEGAWIAPSPGTCAPPERAARVTGGYYLMTILAPLYTPTRRSAPVIQSRRRRTSRSSNMQPVRMRRVWWYGHAPMSLLPQRTG